MKLKRWLLSLLIVFLLGIILPTESGDQSLQSTEIKKLPLSIAPHSAQAAPQLGSLLNDGFENGTGNWNLDSNWQIVSEAGDHVLEGNGQAWATLTGGQYWTNYAFTVDVKLISGSLQLMFRMSDERGRYILGIHAGGMYLRREAPWGKISTDLITDPTPFPLNTWHTIGIDADLNRIRVYIDGALPARIDYTDPLLANLWPLWQGNIGLEVTGTSQARFDDATVFGVVSQPMTWVRTGGPIGGLGYDVRYGTNTNIMYVTDNYSGVFKSNNGGSTWYPTNRGITARFWPSGDAVPNFSLTVDPNNPDIVWAGMKDVKGIFKSTNAGQIWIDVTPNTTVLPEKNFVFRGFTIMPGNSNIVFAAGEIPSDPPDEGKEFDRVGGRVYRTDDGGATWKAIWDGLNLARYVIVHPDNHNLIYISTGIFDREADNSKCDQNPPLRGGVGVVRGEYNGSSYNWTVLNQANGLTDLYVGSLVMHPNNPGILLAGAGNNACSLNSDGSMTGGVFITEDGGNTWHHTLTNDIITSVEFSPSNPDIVYAGGRMHFYISRNGGWDWEMVAGHTFPWGPPGIVAGHPIDILVHPDDPYTLFSNNYGGGNVKSTDGGYNWTLASSGYTGALMFDIEVHPNSPGTVYAVAKSGAFRGTQGGAVWAGITYPPAHLVETYSIALHKGNPQIVLAAEEMSGILYRSTDGGSSWTKVYQLPVPSGERHGFKQIVFASLTTGTPNTVYAGSCQDNNGLHKTSTATSFGIYKSTDGGVTWNAANNGATSDTCVNDLAIHPTNASIVYMATANEGLYKTTNGGGNWSALTGLAPVDVRSIAIHPTSPNILYAGTMNNGVYYSDNGGSTWTHLIAGMEPNDSIWSIVINPVNPDVVYAGSFHSGVYQWNTAEHMWTHINDGLRTRAVRNMDISSDGSVLYAVTWGEGVFRLGEVTQFGVFLPLTSR